MLAWDWSVNLVHVFREANQVADALASKGFSIVEPYLEFRNPPNDVSNLVLLDKMGAPTPRLI